MIKDKYLTSKEAALILGLSHDHVRRLLGDKKIIGEKVGSNWVISIKELEDFKSLRMTKTKE